MITDFLAMLIGGLSYLVLNVSSGQKFPPPLSAEEESALFHRMREEQAEDARSKLIEHNLRLVAHIVRKYYASQLGQDDLISIGTIGLIKAIDSYDIRNGARFATYASKCIQNAMLSQRNKLDLEAKTSHHVAKNGAYSVTYADTGMS